MSKMKLNRTELMRVSMCKSCNKMFTEFRENDRFFVHISQKAYTFIKILHQVRFYIL